MCSKLSEDDLLFIDWVRNYQSHLFVFGFEDHVHMKRGRAVRKRSRECPGVGLLDIDTYERRLKNILARHDDKDMAVADVIAPKVVAELSLLEHAVTAFVNGVEHFIAVKDIRAEMQYYNQLEQEK